MTEQVKKCRRPRRMARQTDDVAAAVGVGGAGMPTKAARVLDLLHRPGGVSLDELEAATGWLPHTTRAALTGLRRKGHAIARDKVEGVTRYAIETPAP